MGFFGPWQPCPHCGANVRKPFLSRNFLCPTCKRPGPWAAKSQIDEWERSQTELQKQTELVLRRQEEQLAERSAVLDRAASLTPIDVPGFVTQKREHAYLSMDANLAEWVKQRGQYEGGGGISGISFGVPGLKGVRAYYGGLSRRKYVAGPEGWRVTDSGTAIVTSKRIVFRGQQKAVEWQFSKILGLDADRSNSCLLVQVSNRQKAHVLQLEDFELFEAALEAAVAAHQRA